MVKSAKILCAVALLAFPAVSHAQAAGSTPATQKAKRAEAKEERKEKKEAHPELHAAMASLERAKKDLEKAASDFGGHKAEAIKAVDEAMKHVKLAEEYDKK